MKLQTDKIIEDYEKFYWKVHGKNPNIVRRGSWIYINKSFTAHRISALSAMIERLKEMKKPIEPVDEPDDIRAIISAIRQDGKHIFRSTNLKDMQKAGNRIAKMAKRVLNILDEDE